MYFFLYCVRGKNELIWFYRIHNAYQLWSSMGFVQRVFFKASILNLVDVIGLQILSDVRSPWCYLYTVDVVYSILPNSRARETKPICVLLSSPSVLTAVSYIIFCVKIWVCFFFSVENKSFWSACALYFKCNAVPHRILSTKVENVIRKPVIKPRFNRYICCVFSFGTD